ncbi:MAG: heliorhodopsin HeR [Candidatus Nanopelagicales bacterium]|nr:heliorhodopsin HeR [Candidatus Nanopelagicales bacterium]
MTTATTQAQADFQARIKGLVRLNLIAGLAHLVQAVLVLVLANDFTLPVTASYMAGPPGTPLADPVTLLDTRIAWGVALFFAISALFHFIVISPPFVRRYAVGLVAKRNYFRWVEYSVSSSIMIVLIAQIVGITDIAALTAIFGVNASMILFGWLQEKYETPGSGGWMPFIFGCIAGVVPWLIIAWFTLAPGSTTGASPPGFVYGIIISLFLFFNCFAIVQFLQYKPVGRFSDYLRGERLYIILSLVAKSALAWQIFAGTLAPS